MEERNVTEDVLNENNTWLIDTSTLYNRIYFSIKKTDKKTGTNDYLYCSHFIADDTQDVFIKEGINTSNAYIYFYTNFETIDEWLAWLAENPITVQYTLATPTYEVLDNASQLALNSLETFNGATYIEIDSRVQPQSCKWEYGTSQVGAYALQGLNENEIDKIERAQLKEMILSLGGNV